MVQAGCRCKVLISLGHFPEGTRSLWEVSGRLATAQVPGCWRGGGARGEGTREKAGATARMRGDTA